MFDPQTNQFRLCRAEQGSKEHQFRIGMEKFVGGDYETAFDWLSKSSKDDFTHYSDQSMPINLVSNDLYIKTYREKVRDGNRAAAFMMAKIYSEGIGVAPNDRKASFYKKQAENLFVEISEQSTQYTVRVKKLYDNIETEDKNNSFELYAFTVKKYPDQTQDSL